MDPNIGWLELVVAGVVLATRQGGQTIGGGHVGDGQGEGVGQVANEGSGQETEGQGLGIGQDRGIGHTGQTTFGECNIGQGDGINMVEIR